MKPGIGNPLRGKNPVHPVNPVIKKVLKTNPFLFEIQIKNFARIM
jgi:hypothetical protein